MAKRVIIEFEHGGIYEINPEKLAKLIWERYFRNESETDKVKEILNDSFIMADFIWELPLDEMIDHTCYNQPDCICLAWKRGEARIKIDEIK